MILRVCVAVLLLPIAARAEVVQLRYRGYAAGLNVVVVDAGLDLTPGRYRVRLNYRTAGTFGAMFPADQEGTVQGRFISGRAVPERFLSIGTFRGRDRIVEIEYPAGDPILRRLVPPAEEEREPVPPPLQRGTVDPLSGIALLVRQVNATGRCDGTGRTFDGRRLVQFTAATVGDEVLEPSSRSGFSGAALRCRFEARQLAGFLREESRERLARPQLGDAWFARTAAAGMLVPVKITFPGRWFGEATLYVTGEK